MVRHVVVEALPINREDDESSEENSGRGARGAIGNQDEKCPGERFSSDKSETFCSFGLGEKIVFTMRMTSIGESYQKEVPMGQWPNAAACKEGR